MAGKGWRRLRFMMTSAVVKWWRRPCALALLSDDKPDRQVRIFWPYSSDYELTKDTQDYRRAMSRLFGVRWRNDTTSRAPSQYPKRCIFVRVRSHVRFVRNPHGLLHFWLVTFQQEWSHGVHCGAVRPANQAKKLPQPRCQKLPQRPLRLKRDSPNTR